MGARGGVNIPDEDRKSFNSLSRDHEKQLLGPLGGDGDALFQLPLSGSHHHDGRRGPARAGDFQLPLSGSPSPIPGFFGSPRLSAAAPLRKNDS